MNFKEYCEKEIFLPWKDDSAFYSDFAEDYQMDYLPEPYYEVVAGQNKLFVLNNNPGIGLDIQLREYIRKNYDRKSYEDISKSLSAYYQKNLRGNAKFRLDKMKKICAALGFDGLENVETFFLHSSKMNKRKFLEKYKEKALPYTDCLKEYLQDKTVLAICAVASKQSISRETLMASDWLMFQAEILGVDFSSAELFPAKEKEGKISCVFLIQNKKIFVFMMGSNSLPIFTEREYQIMRDKLN